MSDVLRITGMVSGMDTDATVKKLIDLEQTKVDRAEQDKQILQWQQEQYREIATMMKTFQDDYFNILKPKNNLMSTASFSVFSAKSSSSAVEATATGGAAVGAIEITSIAQLATRDKYTSDAPVVGSLAGKNAMASTADILNKVTGGSDTLTFSLDGVSKTITLDPAAHNNYASYSDLVSDINEELAKAYPSMNIVASENSGALQFEIKRNGVAEAGHQLSISSASGDLLTDLGFETGQSNVVNRAKSLADTFGLSGAVDLTINGVSNFGITADDSIDSMMQKINNSSAGVTISYDPMIDGFKMEADKEGAANSIAMTDTGGLIAALKLNTHTAAQNAEFTMNTETGSITTTRSTNSFDINGTNVTLKATSTEPVTIDVAADTSSAKENIVKFVEAYNNILDKLHSKANEKRYRDFAPLTSKQKKDLEEDDEKKWQEKAQSGLLRSDTKLRDIASKMRRALYESVEGVGITLKEIGITTSEAYQDGGKLIVDEDKLDKALLERPDEVVQLFTKKSDKDYLDAPNASERYRESGLASRLNDILKDNIRTTGGSGYLIKKAGRTDIPDVKSNYYKQIKAADEKIDKLLKMLAAKEAKYYNQFAKMEAAMQRFNAQSGWLMNQFGG